LPGIITGAHMCAVMGGCVYPRRMTAQRFRTGFTVGVLGIALALVAPVPADAW